MFEHILVPLDESKYSERAIAYAEGLAKVSGGKVSLLVVAPDRFAPGSPALSSDDPITRVQAQRPARAEQYLAEQAAQLKARGMSSVTTEVRFGDTADCIVDAAQELGIDVIAMSTHGLGASGRYALGSVALKVLMTAPCPVFMVRVQEAWKQIPTA